jgi:2-haloacid dehalogenase
MALRGLIFDAYGTLLDIHSVVLQRGHDIQADLPALANLWRRKQLEYTWLRSLMERYVDFWEITEAALRSAIGQLEIAASEEQVAKLMQAYLSPAAFADVKPAVESLKGVPLAILSNGTPRMLEAAIRHNQLESYFAAIISVERVKTYKPSPRVYALGPALLGLPAQEILFVSSNSWDAAGAKAFGYTVCWCNRSNTAPEHLGFLPDLTVSRLDQIAIHSSAEQSDT